MPTYAGSINKASALRWGSCAIEYSSDGTNWSPLGIARGVSFEETIEKTVIQADNAADIVNRIGNQSAMINFNWLEPYLPTINALRGIDVLSVTSAVATTDTDVYTTGQKAKGDVIWLQNNGASDTLPAISKVKSVDTGGSCDTYSATDDYQVVDDTSVSPRRRGIALLAAGAGGDYLDTEALKIKYVYGSISARKLTSGGLTTLNSKYFRLTNKYVENSVTKYLYIVIYSGSIESGLNLAFKSSNEADSLLEVPVSIRATLDTTRSDGDQLFYIEDQQSTD